MKVTKQIKFWARAGQILYFLYLISYTLFEKQLPGYVPPQRSATFAELVFNALALTFFIYFTEAIVRLIGYFAELIEKKK